MLISGPKKYSMEWNVEREKNYGINWKWNENFQDFGPLVLKEDF
jgi:hypothetical protein